MNSQIIGFAIEAHNKVNHLYDGKPYSVHLSMVVMFAANGTVFMQVWASRLVSPALAN